MNKPVAAKSFAMRMEITKQYKGMKEKERILRETRFEARKAQAERTNAKIARRKINEAKSMKYQVIKDLHKTRKWNKAARKTLAKLPAEIFYEKYSTAT